MEEDAFRRSITAPDQLQQRALHQLNGHSPAAAGSLEGVFALPIAAPALTGEREEVQRVAFFGVSRGTLALVVVFLLADPSRWMLDRWSMHNKILVAQSIISAQSLALFVGCLLIVACFDGLAGLRTVFSCPDLVYYLPSAVFFALGNAAAAHAFGLGLGVGTAIALNALYMPLCALLSRWLFRRFYGWLETHALGLLTLSTLTFSELHSRSAGFSHRTSGIAFSVASVVLWCLGSLWAEGVLKKKYSQTPGAEECFYMQKARMGVWGLLTDVVVLMFLGANKVNILLDIYTHWGLPQFLALVSRVLQSWLGGMLLKHLSSVAQAVTQSLTILIVTLSEVLILHQRVSGVAPLLLAGVIALTALMYQMGRKRTQVEIAATCAPAAEEEGLSSDTASRQGDQTESPATVVVLKRAHSDPTDYVGQASVMAVAGAADVGRRTASFSAPDAALCCPHEFDLTAEARLKRCLPTCPRLDQLRLVDPAWLAQLRSYNANWASWFSSRRGVMSQLVSVLAFVVFDSSRTIIYDQSIRDRPIVPQSIVLAMTAVSVVVGTGLAAALHGMPGFKAALSFKEISRCLPVAACFSVGSTLTMLAYSSGISGVENTVIGYSYMPLSALLSRWIFRRAYSGLEWLALTLVVLTASVFVLLQDQGSSEPISALGVTYVLLSVVASCVGSLLSEKIMKRGGLPFYIQNVHLQTGGLITAVVMLWVCGAISDRPNDAFWNRRDTGGGDMQAGIFVGWSGSTYLALAATVLQSWLGGLVAKKLSTVIRSVAQCMSLLIIYFLGDVAIKRLPFDWTVGSMALCVALTVQVFTQAGRPKVPHVVLEEAAAQIEADGAAVDFAAMQEASRGSGSSAASQSLHAPRAH